MIMISMQLKISIEIHTPESEKCLQIVDFISWAIFRKYEYNDQTFFDIIKQGYMIKKNIKNDVP